MVKIDWSKAFVTGTEWIANLAVLNLICLLFSLPIITFIPAISALYTVIYHWLKEGFQEPVLRSFFQAFKQGFRQSFKLILPALVILMILAADIWFFTVFLESSAWLEIYKYSLYTITVLFSVTFLYALSLSKQINRPVHHLYFLAAVFMIRSPLYSLGLVVSIVVSLFVLFRWTGLAFFFLLSIPAWFATLATDRTIYRIQENNKPL